MDAVDGRLHLLVAEDHRAEHHVLGQLVGLGLDHQHGALGTGHHEVKLRSLQLRGARVQDELAVQVAHPRRADRALERDARDRQRSRGADHGRDVGVDLRVDRQHVDDDLHLVVEAVREKRADRAVDQAAGQRFLLAGTPLALEEAARDLAGGIGLLDVVDGQREEILAGLGLLARHDGGQHHRVVHRHEHGAGGLPGDLAGLERDRMGAVLKRLGDFFEHLAFLSR